MAKPKSQREQVEVLQKLESTLDRLNEAHWCLHQMEVWFHVSDAFRYSLGGFLRALSEVSQILRMSLQNVTGFKDWLKERLVALEADPLVSFLAKQRDITVHQKMLLPVSGGMAGIAMAGKFRAAWGIRIDPRMDSDEAMLRLMVGEIERDDLYFFRASGDEDEPAIERSWRLTAFPDDEILDLASTAWKKVGQLVSDAAVWLGGRKLQLQLACFHGSGRVRLKMFSKRALVKRARQIVRNRKRRKPR